MADTTYETAPWNLGELFPGKDAPEIDQATEELNKLLSDFEEFRDQLSPEMDESSFIAVVDAYEHVVRKISRLVYYGDLLFQADTQDQEALALSGKGRQLAAEFENRTLFFKLWWKGLEDDAAERFMEASGDNRYYLEALRLQKPYTLSEPEEKIINIKDVTGHNALVQLYEMLTNRYTYTLEIDGETKELTEEELLVQIRSADPDLRSGSYQQLHSVYEKDATIIGEIYQNLGRDLRSEQIDLRGFARPISVRNLANHIPDDIVDMLLEVCRERASIFHRFFALKARWIGMDQLRRYDLYAPVVQTDRSYAFNDAAEIVLESFREFDPKVADYAKRVLDESHIDSEVRLGKRSGAFCATVEPGLTPYILQSFKGKADDIATLAHELGHAIHSLLASHHSALTQSSSLPLAETASTFSEMLVVDRMMAMDPDPELHRDLLFRQMDDAYATIMRQAYFALFEKEAHDAIKDGAPTDRITEIYFENLKEQFGDSMELNEDFRNEWLRVWHFFGAPFYVYAYSFGQLLVLSLYKQFKEEGESFKPRYLEILSAGGSDAPVRVLEAAGINVASKDFWNGGFDVVEDSLQQLEALPVESQ